MNQMLKTCLFVALTGMTIASQTTSWAAAPKKAVIAQNPYLGAIVIDAATGTVLFEDKADAKGYPASMLKLMDMLIIEEMLDQKKLTLEDQIPVSAKASHIGGSRVWLKEKESFTLDEMLYALMVQSANDVATAIAEKIAGSTDEFVAMMNKRAKELGMNNTVFNSVHGLPPSAGQEHDVTTARDFALLCAELVKHKEVLRYTSTLSHNFRTTAELGKGQIVMTTHNHLILDKVEGCDGLKTGYIAEAGYSIAATAQRKGQRVIAVVLGSTDRKLRDIKAAELLSKGFLALPAAGTAPSGPAANAPEPAPTKPGTATPTTPVKPAPVAPTKKK